LLPASAGSLLGSNFALEVGGDTILWTVGFLWTAQHYNPDDCTFHSYCCENLKSKETLKSLQVIL
jgi:hypothetical protein